MVRLDHVALWTDDIDRLASFYNKYFGAKIDEKYVNASKGFESRFVTFEGGPGGTPVRLELMRTTSMRPVSHPPGIQRMGLTHLALSLGSAELVDRLTNRLRDDGYAVLDGPRRTGDGYYESVVLDPDGNRLEITA
jgi:lactoylglutathione lyase